MVSRMSFASRIAALFILLVLVVLTSACATTPPGPAGPPDLATELGPTEGLSLVPAGELRRSATYSMLAVLLPEDRTPEDVVKAIATAAATHERPLTRSTAELLEGSVLVDVVPVQTILSFDVIDFDALELDAAEVARIKATKTAISMVIAGPAEALAVVQRQAADIARAAVQGGGWLFDGGTFQVFSAERFGNFRPQGFPLEVERLITVMVDDSSAAVRLETLGMERLGLPELRMVDVPRPQVDSAVALFNAAAQILVEQGSLDTAGELVIDLTSARMPHLREAHAQATGTGGGQPLTLRAFWDPTQRPEDSDPVIRLDLVGNAPDRGAAFAAAIVRVFGNETSD